MLPAIGSFTRLGQHTHTHTHMHLCQLMHMQVYLWQCECMRSRVELRSAQNGHMKCQRQVQTFTYRPRGVWLRGREGKRMGSQSLSATCATSLARSIEDVKFSAIIFMAHTRLTPCLVSPRVHFTFNVQLFIVLQHLATLPH